MIERERALSAPPLLEQAEARKPRRRFWTFAFGFLAGVIVRLRAIRSAQESVTRGTAIAVLERFRAKHVLGRDPRMESGSREEIASNQKPRVFHRCETVKRL